MTFLPLVPQILLVISSVLSKFIDSNDYLLLSKDYLEDFLLASVDIFLLLFAILLVLIIDC